MLDFEAKHAPNKNIAELVFQMNKIDETVGSLISKLKKIKKGKKFNSGGLELGPYKFLDSGATYIGQFQKGNREGFGTLIWPDGTIYKGKKIS